MYLLELRWRIILLSCGVNVLSDHDVVAIFNVLKIEFSVLSVFFGAVNLSAQTVEMIRVSECVGHLKSLASCCVPYKCNLVVKSLVVKSETL